MFTSIKEILCLHLSPSVAALTYRYLERTPDMYAPYPLVISTAKNKSGKYYTIADFLEIVYWSRINFADVTGITIIQIFGKVATGEYSLLLTVYPEEWNDILSRIMAKYRPVVIPGTFDGFIQYNDIIYPGFTTGIMGKAAPPVPWRVNADSKYDSINDIVYRELGGQKNFTVISWKLRDTSCDGKAMIIILELLSQSDVYMIAFKCCSVRETHGIYDFLCHLIGDPCGHII